MMGNPFQGIGFGMGGQPQPPQVSPQPAIPTFAPQPQPGPMTEDERRMLLTTANPFSSGPDAINPVMGNRFNQARMEAGMGGIASLMPPQPRMNTPFGGMGGLANLFRQPQPAMRRPPMRPQPVGNNTPFAVLQGSAGIR